MVHGYDSIFMWRIWLITFKYNNLALLIMGIAVMIFTVNIFMYFSN